MGWNIFNSGDDTSPRNLSHPKDLKTGDIIKLGFTGQNRLSNETFKIVDVLTYDLGGEDKKKITFVIENEDGYCHLSVVSDNRGDKLEFGIAVLPEDVDQIFSFDQFGKIFDEELGVNQKLERLNEPGPFSGWTTQVYMQEAGHSAYTYHADYRDSAMPDDADAGDNIDYIKFVGDDRKFALQIEVYEGGKTDVYLQAFLATDKIEEMWPGE